MKKLTIFNETTSRTFLIHDKHKVYQNESDHYIMDNNRVQIATIPNGFGFVIEDMEEQIEELNVYYSADGKGVKIDPELFGCVIEDTDENLNANPFHGGDELEDSPLNYDGVNVRLDFKPELFGMDSNKKPTQTDAEREAEAFTEIVLSPGVCDEYRLAFKNGIKAYIESLPSGIFELPDWVIKKLVSEIENESFLYELKDGVACTYVVEIGSVKEVLNNIILKR